MVHLDLVDVDEWPDLAEIESHVVINHPGAVHTQGHKLDTDQTFTKGNGDSLKLSDTSRKGRTAWICSIGRAARC